MKKLDKIQNDSMKNMFHTWLNVVEVDHNIVISVSTCVLVVETKSVEELVHDGAMCSHTAIHKGKTLRTTDHSNIGRAARNMRAL